MISVIRNYLAGGFDSALAETPQSTGPQKFKQPNRKQENERNNSGHQVIATVTIEAALDVFMLELHQVGLEDEEGEEDDWQYCHLVDLVGREGRNCRRGSRLLLYSNINPNVNSEPAKLSLLFNLSSVYLIAFSWTFR